MFCFVLKKEVQKNKQHSLECVVETDLEKYFAVNTKVKSYLCQLFCSPEKHCHCLNSLLNSVFFDHMISLFTRSLSCWGLASLCLLLSRVNVWNGLKD